MRMLLAAAVFGLCLWVGVSSSAALKKRTDHLRELHRLLCEYAIEMQYLAPTLDELAQKGQGVFAQLLRECSTSSCDVKTAWQSAVKRLSQQRFCGREEEQLLRELGSSLGGSSAQGQLSLLEMNAVRLEQLIQQAQEQYTRKGKLYRTLGAIVGAAAAVMMI